MLRDTRQRVRAIREAIRVEEQRLFARYPWLVHQDLLGLFCFLGSLGVLGCVAWLYLSGMLAWWWTIPLMALPLSVLHEIEHDLIHNLYFRRHRWLQNVMFFVIWYCKLGLNPWYRRGIHLRHHRLSGQKADIEERLLGIGLPFGPTRLLVAIHPFGAVFLFNRIRRDSPDFQGWRLTLLSLPTYLPLLCVSLAFFGYLWLMTGLSPAWDPIRMLPAEAWPFVRDMSVLMLFPNVLRQTCLVLMSSYSHYYEDIPEHDVYYQNQVLCGPLTWPLQVFCFNFGATHIIHHYVVSQPFYLRQMVAGAVHAEFERQGVRVNDLGTVIRTNHWHREPAEGEAVPTSVSSAQESKPSRTGTKGDKGDIQDN